MLMLLPLDKKIDWKNPPIVTILLVITNIIIFYVMQADDNAIEQKAASFYIESGLAKLEKQVYPKFLESQNNKQKLDQFNRDMAEIDNDSSYYFAYLRNYTDLDFAYKEALATGSISNVSRDDMIKTWTQRNFYLAQMSHSTLRNYSLRPADTKIVTLFSHMFLHVNDGHLWGNMLFLLLVGYVVETILGSGIFLLAYLMTGLGASGLDILFHSTDYNFHLGASGAISGVMGLYATLFGWRKIQFFYNILFWVGRVKAPAIIMLFIWVSKEVVQMIAVDSNVNFLAHLGGLLSGALIAYLLLRFSNSVNTGYMDLADKTEQHSELMSKGIQYLGEMKFSNAKLCFSKVLAQEPDDIEVINYLYKASRHEPASNDYHKYTQKLIFACIKSGNFDLMYQTWIAYNKEAEPSVKLNFTDFYTIFEYLLQHNKIVDAEKLLIRLFKKNPQNSQLSTGFLSLAKKYLTLNNKGNADKYSRAIVKFFPHSSEVTDAQSILG